MAESFDISKLTAENESLKSEIEDLKKQLASLQTESTVASNAQNTFLYKISHELRTPLNVVIGFSRLELAKAQNSYEADEMLQIFNAGHELQCIVNNIIDLVAASTGKLELYNTNFYLSRLLSELSRKMQARLEKSAVTFRMEVSENIPEQVFGDFLRLDQIFENLLINAANYTTQGEIVLKLDCMKNKEGGYTFMADVTDTGSGMSPEVLDSILTDCKLFGTDYHKNLSGSGFGLAIVCHILQLMEGDLWAESEPGKGSTFNFSFCMGYVNDNLIRPEELKNDDYNFIELKKSMKEDEKEQGKHDISNAQVLITDDVHTNLVLEKALLAPYGIIPDLAVSGYKCLEMMREKAYDLVLMDQMMPGMDGVETFNHIRNDDNILNGKDIPVIMVTANASPQSESHFIALGFAGYIVKPVYSRRLYELISKCLAEKDFSSDAPESFQNPIKPIKPIQETPPAKPSRSFYMPPLTDLVTGNNILSEGNKRDLLHNQMQTAVGNKPTANEAPTAPNATNTGVIDLTEGVAMFNGREDVFHAVARSFLAKISAYLSTSAEAVDTTFEAQVPVMLKSIAAVGLLDEFTNWQKAREASDENHGLLHENLLELINSWINYFDTVTD